MPKHTSPLSDRLDQLGITPAEVAAIVYRPVELVQAWIDGGLDTEGVVLLRWLADTDDAMRRVEQVRRTHTANLEGDGARYAGITGIPYGTGDSGKVTGGVGA